MLRSLTIATLLSTSLFANSIDDKILKYEKHRVSRNPNIKVNDVKLFLKKDLNMNGWSGYVFDIDLTIDNKDRNLKDIIFSNGTLITTSLKNLNTNQSLTKLMYPTLSFKYYDKKFLIAGDQNAKHKITIFSDPLCPICTDTMPKLIKIVQEHPQELSLYYIHMPLDMHPTAKMLVKASILAKKQGIQNIDYKVYTANFDNDFDPYEEKSERKVLRIFNKKFGTNISLQSLDDKNILEELKLSEELSSDALIQGTPTIFFDGEIDPSRTKYKKYIK